MAFPGGRNEEGENDQDTVAREVMEEVGLDLNTNDFVKLGCLNDREITSLLGGKPFMILSTFGKYLYLDKREWWRAVVQHQLRYTK
jgi:8-oxo-dGTP pyrophosphatase MutT (NUDIX family)